VDGNEDVTEAKAADRNVAEDTLLPSKTHIRGLRQLVGNLLVTGLGLGLFIAIFVSILENPPSAGGRSTETGGLVVASVVIAILIALSIRLRWAFTVDIEADRLTYRKLLRTFHFSRRDVVAVGLADRRIMLPKLSYPYLTLKDGRTRWLLDMAQGKVIAPTSSMQRDLVASITHWINHHD